MRLLLAAATLSAAAAVCSAQAANQPGPVDPNVQQQEAAPIERAYQNPSGQMPRPVGPARVSSATIAPGQDLAPASGEAQATPIQGVILRVGPQSSVQEVSSDAKKLELRVERGVANVNVHDPARDTLILVDLPGGQTQLLKNGLYTFNAESNTARVLHGEALAFPASNANAKPIKVKEYNKVVYSGKNVRPEGFAPYEASVDLLQGPAGPGYGGGGAGPAFGYGPYGDGFYPYYSPYYAYGPWGWGYPYGYGVYPFGWGLGFGYYGGFYGGYRGGYGFHGGGFHGRR